MRTMARTSRNTRSLVISVISARSSFTTAGSRSAMYLRFEYPAPRSSTTMATPLWRSSVSWPCVWLPLLMGTDSVISTYTGWPCRKIGSSGRMSQSSSSSSGCTFRNSGQSGQALTASSRMRRPSSPTTSLRMASSKKSCGLLSVSCLGRHNTSCAKSAPVVVSTIGWYATSSSLKPNRRRNIGCRSFVSPRCTCATRRMSEGLERRAIAQNPRCSPVSQLRRRGATGVTRVGGKDVAISAGYSPHFEARTPHFRRPADWGTRVSACGGLSL